MAVQTPSGSGAGSRSRSWQWTAWSGVALLALVTIHMVAHHFVVQRVGGLRTYRQVLEYIGNPWIFIIENAPNGFHRSGGL